MENDRTYNDFDAFLHDIQSGDSAEPRTLEQIKAAWPKGPTDAERCRQLAKDASAKHPPDWFETEEVIARTRIAKAISEPTQAAQVVNAGSAIPLNKGAERDELMYLLGAEIGDAPLPRFESVSDLGREGIALKPGPALHLRDNTSMIEVLDSIAARSPTESGREFAKSLAAKAREMEVVP